MQSPRFPSERAKITFIITLQSAPLGSINLEPEYFGDTNPGQLRHSREVFGTPDGDSSVGEQLYHLCQNKESVSEYTLKFRTLAAASGWNESSLLTTSSPAIASRCIRRHHGSRTVPSSHHPHRSSYAALLGGPRGSAITFPASPARVDQLSRTSTHAVGQHMSVLYGAAEEADSGSVFVLWR